MPIIFDVQRRKIVCNGVTFPLSDDFGAHLEMYLIMKRTCKSFDRLLIQCILVKIDFNLIQNNFC